MALSDEKIIELRSLGHLGATVILLRDKLMDLTREITAKQAERTNLQAKLAEERQKFQDLWESLKE